MALSNFIFQTVFKIAKKNTIGMKKENFNNYIFILSAAFSLKEPSWFF
jgi:hypothetical protein